MIALSAIFMEWWNIAALTGLSCTPLRLQLWPHFLSKAISGRGIMAGHSGAP